ncbi:MAG: hypothetical protein R6T96_13365 [Longimicrobiales bacterium]
MRHVTDGELHAYLDGALDLLPRGRGEEVREHLASCSVCEERLQDERRIRRKAQGILQGSAPETVDLPPFEDLRIRAEASGDPSRSEPGQERVRGRFRGPLRGIPLAWAATVALALGVGWMGGEIWRAHPQEGARAPSGSSTDAPADVVFPQLESGDPEKTSGRPEETAGPGSGESLSSEPAPPSATGVLEAPLSRESALPSAAEVLEAPTADGSGARLERSLQPPRTSTAGPEVLELPEVETGTPDHSLAIPGLELLSVEWEEWIPGERSLRIRQLLPVGDTLELRYLGMLMGTNPASGGREPEEPVERLGTLSGHPPFPKVMEASLPPGWNQVVMRKGRMWLVARAPVSEGHLRALLRSLR